MSLDNVLAVAAIADGDTQMLVFGPWIGHYIHGICRHFNNEIIS